MLSIIYGGIFLVRLFCHNVGLENADEDFPKTVYSKIPIKVIEDYAPIHLKEEMTTSLRNKFSEEYFNCWGVPSGAKMVVQQLCIGDVVLLMRTIGGDEGEIPVLGKVRAFWKEQMPDLSGALWGSDRFPYIFFFETQEIDLTWVQLKDDVGYKPNYRMPGYLARIAKTDKIDKKFGGTEAYVLNLVNKMKLSEIEAIVIDDLGGLKFEDEYFEGKKSKRHSSYHERNPKARARAILLHGTRCKVCDFDFKEVYGKRGEGYIEVHHLKPVNELNSRTKIDPSTDLTVLCSNCHRMIHRKRNKILSIQELRDIVFP